MLFVNLHYHCDVIALWALGLDRTFAVAYCHFTSTDYSDACGQRISGAWLIDSMDEIDTQYIYCSCREILIV